jgi:hypothetical protein
MALYRIQWLHIERHSSDTAWIVEKVHSDQLHEAFWYFVALWKFKARVGTVDRVERSHGLFDLF